MKRSVLCLMMLSAGIVPSHGDGIADPKENFIGCWTQDFSNSGGGRTRSADSTQSGAGKRSICLSSDLTAWGTFREDGVVSDIDVPSWRIKGRGAELVHGSDEFSETCRLARRDKRLTVSRCALSGTYSFTCMPREGSATCIE